MKKKTYEKPTMTVVELQHRTCLLQASGEQQPENVPDYGDWLGAPEFDWVDKGYQFGGWDIE